MADELNLSMPSEVREYEEAKVPAPMRISAFRRGSIDEPIGNRIPRADAESDLNGA